MKIGVFHAPDLRLAGGMDYYFNDDTKPGVVAPVVELAMKFRFRKEPSVYWDPYLVTGLAFPYIAQVGAGNRFRLSEKLHLFTELTSEPLVVYTRGSLRVGLSWGF